GYAPTTTYSVHWLADPGFHDAVARYLEDEREAVAAESQALLDYTPFKKGH
ncbi:MAG: GNAT family N-acetyltransferase, partial [Chloroflexi bacterium]|nr:GNAT family N-acetyltransferase [Chloroflexota bacterium]